MTDQPDLQAALIPLAERAIEDTNAELSSISGRPVYFDKRRSEWLNIPGADGTLTDAEVTVVLRWLAKVGYEIRFFGNWCELFKNAESLSEVVIIREQGDTLNAALAAAVLALHEASK